MVRRMPERRGRSSGHTRARARDDALCDPRLRTSMARDPRTAATRGSMCVSAARSARARRWGPLSGRGDATGVTAKIGFERLSIVDDRPNDIDQLRAEFWGCAPECPGVFIPYGISRNWCQGVSERHESTQHGASWRRGLLPACRCEDAEAPSSVCAGWREWRRTRLLDAVRTRGAATCEARLPRHPRPSLGRIRRRAASVRRERRARSSMCRVLGRRGRRLGGGGPCGSTCIFVT